MYIEWIVVKSFTVYWRKFTIRKEHEIMTSFKEKKDLTNETLQAIIEFSTDGIYVVNKKGITIYVNEAYEKITGTNKQNVLGKHMQTVIDEGYIDQSVSLLVLEEKKRRSIMQTISSGRDVMVTGNPVFNKQGEIELVVTTVQDITQLNAVKKELLKVKEFSHMNANKYAVKVNGSEQPLVFQSNKMNLVYQQAKRVAPFPTSILLSGPSGSGKEVVANLIHDSSDRNNQPFIKVNCGAIPEPLLESELFGYEKGAFTGARTEGKIGLLELADGGTLMLDEIGEMPISLQVKLLRVLQEKQVQKIGGTKTKSIDIRIISATNQHLGELIQKGRFREDLYYRLKVVEITLPHLSQRKEDISLLVDHYVSYFCSSYYVQKRISNKAKQMLEAYQWPGNVRELRNMVENMIVSIPGEIIEAHHLPFHTYNEDEKCDYLPLKKKVEQFEQRLVKETIQHCSSLRQAAKELGIDHSTLIKKLKRWECKEREEQA